MNAASSTGRFDPAALVDQAHIILCGGTGGVGKTTTAAALGVLAAGRGRNTLVITVDPARRLATAMGLPALASEPQPVPEVPGLSAMMLDATRTFDDLVARYARDAASRDAILSNAYYQQVSASIAGSREFMAMEQVYALAETGQFELLVVDTPPSQHAIDFLDAPRRMLELLDGSGLGILLQTANVANRLSFGMLRRSQDQVLKLFETFTGHRVLVDLNEFFAAFADVFDDFRQRSRRIAELLRAPQSQFVVVTVADPALLEQAGAFTERLRQEHMHIAGAIVNRVFTLPPGVSTAVAPAQLAGLDAALTERICQAAAELGDRAAFDARIVAAWTPAQLPVLQVPQLGAEIADLAQLRAFAAALS